MNYYEIKRTVIETFYVDARTKKEALQIIGDYGGPTSVIIKSETVKKLNKKQ